MVAKSPSELPAVKIIVNRHPRVYLEKEALNHVIDQTRQLVDCDSDLGCTFGPGALNSRTPFTTIDETLHHYFDQREVLYHIEGRRVSRLAFRSVDPLGVHTIAYVADLRSDGPVALNLIRRKPPIGDQGVKVIMQNPKR